MSFLNVICMSVTYSVTVNYKRVIHPAVGSQESGAVRVGAMGYGGEGDEQV